MTSRFGLLKAAALFVTVFFVLQLAYSADFLGGARAFVVADVVVRPAAALINLVDPHAAAWPEGERLRSPAGGVRILQGCEGIEVMFLLTAAMACAPLALRHRMTGTLIGIAVVFVLSQLRVLGLFYAHRAGPHWFDAIHGTVAPLATLAGALAFFLWWLSRKAAPPSSAA